jgi:hypothetical protein
MHGKEFRNYLKVLDNEKGERYGLQKLYFRRKRN